MPNSGAFIVTAAYEPFGFLLRPEIGAISMSGSSILVALNAIDLRRLHLPGRDTG